MRYLPLVLAGLLLSGCGGGSDQPADKPAPTSKAPTTTPAPGDALEESVRAYSAAFLRGDGAAAYELLSKRCRNRTRLSEFEALAEQAQARYGPEEIATLKVKVNGDQAQATYTYAQSQILDQDNERWVNEAGWRNDDC